MPHSRIHRAALRPRADAPPALNSLSRTGARAAPGFLAAALLALTFSFLFSARAAVLYVNPTAPGPEHNGQTWATAFQTLTPAVGAGAPGDEIWVAQGTYAEPIETSKAILFFGGFAGTENARAQRDPQAYLTVLQGDTNGPVVRFTDVPATGGLDGFTIGGGLYGVSLEGGAPLITGNVFTGNRIAIDALESSPAVASNRFNANFDGMRFDGGAPVLHANTVLGQTRSGITLWDSAAVLRDNSVLGCGEGGLTVQGGTLTAVNNSFIGCQTGVYLDGVTGLLANNLVAYHFTGVTVFGDASALSLKSNGFYGSRTAFDGIADPTGTNGNITADPRLASAMYGNFHLQPDSPMRDAGDDTAVVSGDTDIDGQARLQGTVDIGADESDNSAWTVTPTIMRVNADSGDDANDGSDWSKAKKTIQAAMDAAMLKGGEVWAANGIYPESVTLRPFAYLYGGFTGNEVARDPNHKSEGGTVLAAGAVPSGVKARGGHTFTLMDGLTVEDAFIGGSLIGSSTTLANNRFTNAGAVSATNDAANISHNQFSLRANGFHADSSYVNVVGNTITGGPLTTSGTYSAIYLTGCSGLIAGNLITTHDTGINLANSAPNVLNNTISGPARGIYYISVEPLIANNIINVSTYGSSGITRSVLPGTTQRIWNNDVYGTSGAPYPTPYLGNISKAAKFRDAAHGNYRLAADSPCIDAGSDLDVTAGTTDLDGKPRILGLHVDMGAYEYTASQFVLADAVASMRIAAGLVASTVSNEVRLDVETTGSSAGKIDLADTLRILRNAVGLDAGA